jgi:hypothetical protein
MKKAISLVCGLGLVVGLAGCPKKVQVKDPEPVKKVEPVVAPSTKNYVVQKGDSLWKISAKGDVLGDSFNWPLLFKANRDQIEDPDMIEVRQDLNYKASYEKTEVEEAVKKAQDTPPFVPHASPRKVLPVKY